MEDILKYLLDPDYFDPQIVRMIDYIRFIFIGVSFVMLLSVIYFIIRTNFLEEKYFKDILEFTKTSPYKDVKLSTNWKEVKEKIQSEDESTRKLAVIEADNVLAKILNEMGYEGDDLEEALEGVGKEIVPNKNNLLEVHKVRRDMVYDPNYELSEEEAKEMIKTYEETLEDLQLL